MTVADPDVVDLISLGADACSAALVAVEHRPLRDVDEQLYEVDRKLGAYMYAVDTGQIAELAGRSVSLVLVVPNEPRPSRARLLLERINEQCLVKGLGFSVIVQAFPEHSARFLGLSEDERRPFDPTTDATPAFPVVRERLSDEQCRRIVSGNPELAEWLAVPDQGQRDESAQGRVHRRLKGRGSGRG